MTDVQPIPDWDVAISFLNGDLSTAVDLADRLRDRMTVFLFTERQEDIAGSDGVETLQRTFRSGSRIIVVLYRTEWGETPWTRVEAKAIQEHGLEQGWETILLAPLERDVTPPGWLPKSQIWYSYDVYGLEPAVAVIERMFEAAGGRVRSLTAADHGARMARQAAWEDERERALRSEAAVRKAQESVALLFEQLRGGATAGSAAGIRFDSTDERSARIWTSRPNGEGTTVTLFWQQSYRNTLDSAELCVKLFKGYIAIGKDINSREPAVELQAHYFLFDLVAEGKWQWRHSATSRTYEVPSLATFCMHLLGGRAFSPKMK